MPNRIPSKNLTAINWIISSISSVLVLVFFLAITLDVVTSVLRFLEVFFFIGLTSFGNMALLKIFSANKKTFDQYSRIKFYLASYLNTIIVWLAAKTLYSAITHLKWEGDNEHIYQSYSFAILSIWVLNTLILFLHNMVILQYRKTQGEIENLQLKANLSETENLLLRQQIHPHFLFNALNTVKSLYKTDAKLGEDYLVHLANFLRVTISNQNTKTTLIKNELDFCLDYLSMQKIRFGTALDYSITLSAQTTNHQYLPYFSLQPLVENALKHNSLTEENPIHITIREKDDYIYVSNNLQPRNYKVTSTGQGLLNLAERYRLLGEQAIKITSDSSFFTVRMKILDK